MWCLLMTVCYKSFWHFLSTLCKCTCIGPSGRRSDGRLATTLVATNFILIFAGGERVPPAPLGWNFDLLFSLGCCTGKFEDTSQLLER